MVASLRRAVDAGKYSSSSEVVREALRDWSHKRQRQQNGIEELRPIWRVARETKSSYVPAAEVMDRFERKYQAIADAAGATRVAFSLNVENDLDEIAAYIAADNPRRARTFIREIRPAMGRIGEAPQLYQLRPEIGEAARLAVAGRYVILFRIDSDVVRIERVVH